MSLEHSGSGQSACVSERPPEAGRSREPLLTQFRIIALLSVLLAVAIGVFWQPVALEERLIDIQLEQILPADARAFAEHPIEVRALLVDYSEDALLLLQAQAALVRYPALSPSVMTALGDKPEFWNALREYGPAAIPPIHFFMNNEVRTVALIKLVGEVADRFQNLMGNKIREEGELIAPEVERGLYAVTYILGEGPNFIGQFVIDADGEVAWVQSERLLENLNTLTFGGIRQLESRMRRGEPVRMRDLGDAGIDLAIGFGVFKLVKATRGPTATGRPAALANQSVAMAPVMVRQSAVASRLVRIGAPLTMGYLMIRHPSLINSALAWTANQLGWPVLPIQIAGWALLLTILLNLLRLLLWPIGLMLGISARMTLSAARWGRASSQRAPALPGGATAR